jgi:hypothetical protein
MKLQVKKLMTENKKKKYIVHVNSTMNNAFPE